MILQLKPPALIKRSWTHPISGGIAQPWNHSPKIREKVWHLFTIVHFDRNSYGVSGVSGSKLMWIPHVTCHDSSVSIHVDPRSGRVLNGNWLYVCWCFWRLDVAAWDPGFFSIHGRWAAPRFRTWSHHLQCDHQRLSEVRPMARGRGNQWGVSMTLPQ